MQSWGNLWGSVGTGQSAFSHKICRRFAPANGDKICVNCKEGTIPQGKPIKVENHWPEMSTLELTCRGELVVKMLRKMYRTRKYY
jgi:hypothetical protein